MERRATRLHHRFNPLRMDEEEAGGSRGAKGNAVGGHGAVGHGAVVTAPPAAEAPSLWPVSLNLASFGPKKDLKSWKYSRRLTRIKSSNSTRRVLQKKKKLYK